MNSWRGSLRLDVNSKTYQPVLNTLLRSSTRRQSFDGKATRQSRYSVTTAIATRSINEDSTMPDLLQLSRFLDQAKNLLPAAVALRRRIHSKPELGLDLPLTTEAVLNGLKGLDVEIARGKSTSIPQRSAAPARFRWDLPRSGLRRAGQEPSHPLRHEPA